MNETWKTCAIIIAVIVIAVAVAKALGCGCAGGDRGFACGCAAPVRRENFSFGKVGEFIGAVGELAALGAVDVVASTGRWVGGNIMDGIRHGVGWVEGKDVQPVKHDSFWIW